MSASGASIGEEVDGILFDSRNYSRLEFSSTVLFGGGGHDDERFSDGSADDRPEGAIFAEGGTAGASILGDGHFVYARGKLSGRARLYVGARETNGEGILPGRVDDQGEAGQIRGVGVTVGQRLFLGTPSLEFSQAGMIVGGGECLISGDVRSGLVEFLYDKLLNVLNERLHCDGHNGDEACTIISVRGLE